VIGARGRRAREIMFSYIVLFIACSRCERAVTIVAITMPRFVLVHRQDVLRREAGFARSSRARGIMFSCNVLFVASYRCERVPTVVAVTMSHFALMHR